jgi:hypothetical protein
LEHLLYFGVAAAIGQVWILLELTALYSMPAVTVGTCHMLVDVAWWLFFLISLFSERDGVFFFSNSVFNVATWTIIHEKI